MCDPMISQPISTCFELVFTITFFDDFDTPHVKVPYIAITCIPSQVICCNLTFSSMPHKHYSSGAALHNQLEICNSEQITRKAAIYFQRGILITLCISMVALG